MIYFRFPSPAKRKRKKKYKKEKEKEISSRSITSCMFRDWFKDIARRLESKNFLSFRISVSPFENKNFLSFLSSVSPSENKNFLSFLPSVSPSENKNFLSFCPSVSPFESKNFLSYCPSVLFLSISELIRPQKSWAANRCSTKWDFSHSLSPFVFSFFFLSHFSFEGAQRTAPFTQ